MSTTLQQQVEIERSVVAAAFVDPEILTDLRVPPDDFADASSGAVLAAMLGLRERGDYIGVLGVKTELSRLGKAESASTQFLQHLAGSAAPISVAVVDRLHELAELRRMRAAAQQVIAACETGHLEGAREAHVDLAHSETGYGSGPVRLREMAVRACAEVVAAARAGGVVGIPWGLPWLNRSIGSIRPGNMLTLGAPTGTGKSRFVLTNVLAMSKHAPIGWISCEDAADVIGERYGGIESRISPLEMRTGLDPVKVDHLARALERFSDPDVFVETLIGKRDVDVLQSMRQMAHRHGCKHIVIDYVQAVRPSVKYENRAACVGDMTARFKGQAQSLGCSLTLVSQITRTPRDQRNAKWEPSMHDLKESGDLENASEAIVLLWPEVNKDGEKTGRVMAKIGKGKSGSAVERCILISTQSGQLVELETRREAQQERF